MAKHKGGRRPLIAGMPRLLPNHRGAAGNVYRDTFRDLVAQYGRDKALARLIGLAARAYVLSDIASRAYLVAYEQREVGTGRRPSAKLVASLETRQGLAMDRWTRALWAVQSAAGALQAPPRETPKQREEREVAQAKVRHADWLASIPRRPKGPTLPQDSASRTSILAEGAEVATSPQDGSPRG